MEYIVWLDQFSFIVLFGAVVLSSFASLEIGYRLGQYRRKQASREKMEAAGVAIPSSVQQLYLAQHARAGKLDRLPKWVRTTIILAILITLWSIPPMIEYIRKASFGEWIRDWLYLGAGAILFVLIAPAIDELLIKRKSKSRFKY